MIFCHIAWQLNCLGMYECRCDLINYYSMITIYVQFGLLFSSKFELDRNFVSGTFFFFFFFVILFQKYNLNVHATTTWKKYNLLSIALMLSKITGWGHKTLSKVYLFVKTNCVKNFTEVHPTGPDHNICIFCARARVCNGLALLMSLYHTGLRCRHDYRANKKTLRNLQVMHMVRTGHWPCSGASVMYTVTVAIRHINWFFVMNVLIFRLLNTNKLIFVYDNGGFHECQRESGHICNDSISIKHVSEIDNHMIYLPNLSYIINLPNCIWFQQGI